MNGRPDRREPWVRMSTRALHPDYKQYFICYSTPRKAGLQFMNFWSPNSLEHVQEAFEYNEYERGLIVHFISCPGTN